MRPSMALARGAMVHLLLLLCRPEFVQSQSDDSSDSTCSTFSAHVLGSAGNQTFQDTFNCSDGAYVTGVNITYGWWIDGLQIFCSTGNASDWYGDETLEGVEQAFVDTWGGLTSMTSQFRDDDGQHFPCFLTFLAYTGEVEGSASESEIGPYGSCGRSYSSTSPTSQWDTVSGEFNGTSDCGLDAYAIGFFMHYDDEFIYGLGLQCRTITAACPAPDGLGETHSLPPTFEPSTLLPTHAPSTFLPTPAPTRETPAPVEPTVELGEDCSEFSCVEGLCCSEDHICGATASFCRDGLCCSTSDGGSECTPGSNQCLTEDETEVQWYDTPIFIGTSTVVGLVITVGGACYAVYRHFREQRTRAFSLPWKRGDFNEGHD